MLREKTASSQKRVLIASADLEGRRTIGEIVKAAHLRTIGFIREPDQVEARTLLSMPDVLLLDAEMLRSSQAEMVRVKELRDTGAIRIVVWGHRLSALQVTQHKRDGVDDVLDLGSFPLSDTAGMAQQLDKAAQSHVNAHPKSEPPQVVGSAPGVRRKTLVPECVVIGSSTGGPMALMTLLKGLPADFPLPIAVVQHMPAGFTRMLAERLHAECALRVVEGETNMSFSPGSVYIAPGGKHMILGGTFLSPRIELSAQDPENSCRPAVDVLFRSSASLYGGRQHAIVLTGMGRDGLAGASQLHSLGSRIVVQDAASSTVWGMPGAIAHAGLADEILPITLIAPHLLKSI